MKKCGYYLNYSIFELVKEDKVSISMHSTNFTYILKTRQIRISSHTHTSTYTIEGFGSNYFLKNM
ncbi:MAG: hypothetical protein ACFFCQ_04565, partial [Promethearchaeota archaeon]